MPSGGLSLQFFRTVIGKKMNARSGNGSATLRKYFLEDGTKGKRRGGRRCGCQEEEEEEEEREESCRWDRTDSECKFIIAATHPSRAIDITILCLKMKFSLFFYSLVQSLFWRYESENIMVNWRRDDWNQENVNGQS